MKAHKKLIIAVSILIGFGLASAVIAAYTTYTAISNVTITSHETGDIVWAGKEYTLTCTTSTDTDCNTDTGQTVSDQVTHTWSGPGTFDPTTGTSVTWTAPSTTGNATITVTASDSPLADDTDKTDSVTLTVTGDPLGEYLPYGMEVNSVTIVSGVVTVTTTGATYVLSTTGMDMYRRIDPNTNTVDTSNSGKGRKVAELDFSADIGSLSIDVNDSNRVIVESTKATFDFQSDSFFFVTAKESFRIKHTNLIADVPWNAPLDSNDRDLDRMWTDGYGGSLLAHVSEDTKGSVYSEDVNYTDVTLSAGDKTAHMVYPPKTFDFEGLYGTNSRPHVHFLYSTTTMDKFINDTDSYRQNLIDDGFGVIMLWNHIYGNGNKAELLDSDPNILGYNVTNPDDVNDLITTAHDNGFKVITYLYTPSSSEWNYPSGHAKVGEHQDIAVTLQFMRDFQEEYNFDGWYFDNGDTGDLHYDYNFMRQVRTDVGDNGIIYHHDSVDIWSMTGGDFATGYKGLRAIMVNAYVNYTLTGETGTIAEVDSPYDSYFRFYTSSYGMSQAYAAHKRRSNRSTAISEEEKNRVLAENLNGSQRNRYTSWVTHFKPAFDVRKTEYAGANFDPDFDWPIDPNTGWFRTPMDINVTDVNNDSATITWTTDANSNSEVAYTSDGIWWSPNGPDGTVSDSNMVASHSITLTGLDSGKNYEFKIRSNNGDANIPGEIIWGYVGNFTTD